MYKSKVSQFLTTESMKLMTKTMKINRKTKKFSHMRQCKHPKTRKK
jgi:hypothetical protein